MMREGFAFIDKTEFIKDFMASCYQVNAILRPRRFGKSTNLGMLETFLSHDTSPDYKKFFDGTLVGKYNDFFEANFRAFPVLYLDLKNCMAETWNDMYGLVWAHLQQMVAPHAKYLARYNNYARDQSLKTLPYDDQVPPQHTELFLGYAMRALHLVCLKKVIVLVDEFDAPLNYAFRHGYYDCASRFFGQMFSFAFKSNTALKRACMVGILQPIGSGILSQLNNIGVFSVADEYFSRHFGFTHEEISNFLNNDADLVAKVLEWYNGYQIGPHLVVNPWSFMSFVARQKLRSYWIQTSYFESVATVLEPHLQKILAQTFCLLNQGTQNCVTVPVLVPNINYANATFGTADNILHFLVLTGYLTYQPIDDETGTVFIPNKEIRMHWASEVVSLTKSYLHRTCPGFYSRVSSALTASPYTLKP